MPHAPAILRTLKHLQKELVSAAEICVSSQAW
jgi:hypothetical protein